MWFFTADLHLNHSNIVKYSKRPFMNDFEASLLKMVENGSIPINEVTISKETTELMTDTIIESINNVVGRRDYLVIAGDFCYSRSKTRETDVKSLRKRIRCENVFLVLGNHDDRKTCAKYFQCLENYTFNIDGQKIFVSHYPCRSWDKKMYGTWMLYGHVHGSFDYEDKNGFSKEREDEIKNYLLNYLDLDKSTDVINFMKKTHRKMLTLDVGVDNKRENVSFGTPWSFEDIKKYMNNQ